MGEEMAEEEMAEMAEEEMADFPIIIDISQDSGIHTQI